MVRGHSTAKKGKHACWYGLFWKVSRRLNIHRLCPSTRGVSLCPRSAAKTPPELLERGVSSGVLPSPFNHQLYHTRHRMADWCKATCALRERRRLVTSNAPPRKMSRWQMAAIFVWGTRKVWSLDERRIRWSRLVGKWCEWQWLISGSLFDLQAFNFSTCPEKFCLPCFLLNFQVPTRIRV